MESRTTALPDRPEASLGPAEPVASAPAAPADTTPGGDALSEFPTEADVRLGRRIAGRPASAGRQRRLLAAGGVVLVLALAAFGGWRWWVARGGSAAAGTLTLESSPPGAAVVIDGIERGRTPLNLSLPAGSHSVALSSGAARRELLVTVTARVQVVHHVEIGEAAPTTGSLHLNGPAGASVTLDGTYRGTMPVELAGIPAGEHTVTVGDGRAAVTQRVVVTAGGVASVLIPLAQPGGAAPAWISIASPIELQVFDGDALIGSSTNRILVLAGRHTLRLVNPALEYQSTRAVQVEAGRVALVRVDVPNGVLHVNAVPWAEVLVDGKRVGETPIANLSLPIGPHEVTLRNPKFAEQKRSVVVSLAGAARVGVDLRQ